MITFKYVNIYKRVKMKARKIRGHKRRWRDIDLWIESNINLNLEDLKEHQRKYAKIRVHPWSGISVTNSKIPEPGRTTKAKILHGLIEIYESWKRELDGLGESYYLKLWLFEPKFSSSQVVCAIRNYLDFYENTFYKPDGIKEIRPEVYGLLTSKISTFDWEYRIDEYHMDEPGSPEIYEQIEDYEEDKKWFEQMLKKPHRITKIKGVAGEVIEMYSFEQGVVWLGQK